MALETTNSEVLKSGSTVSLAAAILVSIAGIAAFSVLPLTVGAISDLENIGAAKAGFVASTDLVGFAISSIVAAVVKLSIRIRILSFVGLILAMSGNAASIVSEGFVFLVSMRLIAGAGAGAAYAAALAALGDAQNPDRAFGFMIAAQIAFQVLALQIIAELVPISGAQGVFFFQGAIAGIAVLGSIFMAPLTIQNQDFIRLIKSRHLAWRDLLAVALFIANISAVWAFIELIGLSAEVKPETIADVLSLALALSIFGAISAAIVGGRLNWRLAIAFAVGLQLSALTMLTYSSDFTTFAIGAVLYSFAWAFAPPFLFATIARNDHTGRSMLLAPAAQAAGAGLGPIVAAVIFVKSDIVGVTLFAATMCTLVILIGAGRSAVTS